MVTRKTLPLQEQHLPALTRQHGGGGAATWAATNHDHIGGEVGARRWCHSQAPE